MSDNKGTNEHAADTTGTENEHGEHNDQGEESSKRRNIEGQPLIDEIRRKLKRDGLAPRHIADVMGVTTIYWNSMTNGNRSIGGIGYKKFRSVANFLGIPTAQAMLLAEVLKPQDFFVERTLDDTLLLTANKIRSDPNWMGLMLTENEWAEAPQKTRLLLALLYEQVSKDALMHKVKAEMTEGGE